MHRQASEIDTIAAIATPAGLGGVGVIRISGAGALAVLQQICQKSQFTPRQMQHTYIIDRHRANLVLDEVMAVYFKAPQSYTGEDVGEVFTHGGVAIVNAVLSLILRSGARMAEPGEFTKRAFLNGKLDLAQAEAVADVINASSEKAMLSAGRNLRGELSQKLNAARKTLLNIIMLFEASIDFPDDVEDPADVNLAVTRLKDEVSEPLAQIHKNYIYGCYLRNGLKLAVVGRPNVGKSSLMNAFLGHERVLVSEEAGTTRDVVTERWNIGGLPVELADTAGIHQTTGAIEQRGIAKSFAAIDNSDYVLFMFEADKGLTADDKEIISKISTPKIIGVANKIDLGLNFDEQAIATYFTQIVPVSVKNNQGLDVLEKVLIAAVAETSQDFDNMIIPNLRQTELIAGVLDNVAKFYIDAKQQLPAEYLVTHLEEALQLINTILGLNPKTDILDEIFANFCIGK